MQFQTIKITAKDEGKRLDTYLAKKLKLSRNAIQRLIKEDNVHINKQTPKKSGVKLNKTDIIAYRIPKVKKTKIKAEKIPLEIIFENNDMLVINKEAGLVVHPDSTGHESGTIVNAVLAHCKKLSGIGGKLRPGIVHRLDKDTSGALLIAKNDKTHEKLSKLFQERKVEKKYWALVKGTPKTKKGHIEAPIRRNRKERKQMAISKQGKTAITEFEVLEAFPKVSLLEVDIKTGRTHQIRLHLASIGHPVIGDSVYGNDKINKEFKEKFKLKRQFLHAKTLKINKKTFTAPLSKDLENTLNTLRDMG